ncbi:hypothetical protein [Mesorhizobium huakuii]|uniref:Uncharacterized protein n=1 Tax=Mesorhizobium huakuii TaxID=28104 RepID=A0A7G6SUN3_9HYPH|nr:hypothetical protein [Mesorhizobium huakuii]QND58215.1 hypothetical protein HB778_17670 [Mesorhizobium huakuii]
MSETIQGPVDAFPHNPQRPGLVERLLMPFAGRAEEATMRTGKLSFMNQHVNRRAIVAASAAAGIAGMAALGAIAKAHAEPTANAKGRPAVDPKLRKLEAAFNAEWRRYEQLEAAHTAAEEALFVAKPPKPDHVEAPAELYERFRTLRMDQMNTGNPIYAALDEYQEMNKTRLDQWEAECEAVKGRPEFEEPFRAFRQQLKRNDEAADRVLRYPARSVAEVQVKMRVHRKNCFEEDQLVDALARDIARIAKVERARSGVSRGTDAVTV